MRPKTQRICAFERCVQPQPYGEKWCYFHAKVMAGLLTPHPDSRRNGTVDPKLIDQIEKKELKRLEDLLNGR